MAKTRRVFISDTHLSSKDLYGKNIAWPTEEQRERLNKFLNTYVLPNAAGIKDLVLLGDIFDTWVCPTHDDPPTYDAIFASNPEFIRLLNQIQNAGVQVFYLVGNHDFPPPTRLMLDKVPGIQVLDRPYRSGLFLAEHGSQYDVFNKEDRNGDPAFGRPIGYFISRLAATRGALPTQEAIRQLICDTVTARNDYSKLVDAIIDALALHAGLKDADKIKMPDNLPEITLAEVKQRYATFQSDANTPEFIKKLWEFINPDAAADRLCKDEGYNLVVFGHSHHAALDKDWIFTRNFLYANSGCWTKDKAHFIEVDKNPRKPGLHVTLFEVDINGVVEKEDRATVA